MDNPDRITYFAQTDARNRKVTFGIKDIDRTKHIYVIGKTGMGKSTLLENMAAQDIRNGNGFAFMDPHGSAIDTLLQYIPKERINDVIYFAPFDMEFPIAFNVMEDVGYDKRHLVVSGLMSTFKKIWQDAWSARMEYILSNTLLALLEYPDATLLEVNKMLSDKDFRNKVVDNITDSAVKSFWVDEFAKYTDRFAAEATPAIQNKIGQFTANPLIRNIIGQPKSSFDLRQVMDDKKILLVNLSKGRIGESNANLLGSMLITKMYLAALSRADVSKADIKALPNFYVYVDEFQSFANDSFADILSEARKYKLNLTIAHQYIEQMSDEVRAAVFGNVGTMISFRVGSFDAEVLEKEFAPVFLAEDIVNLGFAQIYLRLMIDGIGSQPFSATTIPPLELQENQYVEEIIGTSRKNFAYPRLEVEEFIKTLHSDKKDQNKNGNNQGTTNQNGNNQGSGSQNNNKSSGGQNGGSKNGNNQINNAQKESAQNGGSQKGYDQNGARQNDNRKAKTKPVIDKNKQQELQKQLEEFKSRKITEAEIIENEEPAEDLANISLKDLAINTQNGNKKNNDSQNNSVKKEGTVQTNSENKNSLKNALAGILKDIKEKPAQENIKVNLNLDEKIEEARMEANKKESKHKSEPRKEEPKSSQSFSEQPEIQKPQQEISEEELRKILEV